MTLLVNLEARAMDHEIMKLTAFDRIVIGDATAPDLIVDSILDRLGGDWL